MSNLNNNLPGTRQVVVACLDASYTGAWGSYAQEYLDTTP